MEKRIVPDKCEYCGTEFYHYYMDDGSIHFIEGQPIIGCEKCAPKKPLWYAPKKDSPYKFQFGYMVPGKEIISEAYQKHKETFIREGLSQDFTEKLIVPGETEKKMTLDDLIKLEDEMIAKGFRPIVSLAEIKKKKEEK